VRTLGLAKRIQIATTGSAFAVREIGGVLAFTCRAHPAHLRAKTITCRRQKRERAAWLSKRRETRRSKWKSDARQNAAQARNPTLSPVITTQSRQTKETRGERHFADYEKSQRIEMTAIAAACSINTLCSRSDQCLFSRFCINDSTLRQISMRPRQLCAFHSDHKRIYKDSRHSRRT